MKNTQSLDEQKITNQIEEFTQGEFKAYIFSYLKIIAFRFIFPIWIVVFINEGAAVFKVLNWFQQDINFYEVKSYFSTTMIIFFLPFVYIWWFIILTIKKILLQVHQDFFLKWNRELSKMLSEYLINSSEKMKEGNFQMNLDSIIIWMNQKLDQLPKWLSWISKKLFNQIPLLEFVNAYDFKDLKNQNKDILSNDIYEKINSVQIEIIKSGNPWWTKFIIPLNLILLIFYFQL